MFVYIIFLLVFLSSIMMFYLMFSSFNGSRNSVSFRLKNIAGSGVAHDDSEFNKPLFERFLKPILDSMSRAIIKITPGEFVSSLEKKITIAGKPFNLTVKDWMNIEFVFILISAVIAVGTGFYLHVAIKSILMYCMFAIAVAYVIPRFILGKSAKERQKKVLKTMPDFLDLMTVSVEAGLAFDSALSRVILKIPGPLSFEFGNVLQEIRVGKQKKNALKDLSERMCIPELTSFINSIIQADQLGVSIGNVLRIQAAQMRQNRKQKAQEKAMKAPIKMLIPMLIFIFPIIFVVLLGPIVIKFMDVFLK